MAPCLPFSSTYTHPLTGHHSTSPPERPTSTLQLFQRHQTLPQSHSTSHSTTSHITSRTTNSLQPNHYHQHHYSIPTSTSYSRCATNRAAGGHAPTNYPADCAPSRCCSRGRAQLTPQQLIVSPCTFTQRVMTKKNATSVQFFTYHFSFYLHFPTHSFWIATCFSPRTLTGRCVPSDRSRFLNSRSLPATVHRLHT